MVSPLIQDPNNPNVFEFKGKQYHFNVKSTTLTEEEKIALTTRLIGILNKIPKLGEQEQLDKVHINKEGITFSDEELTPFKSDQIDSFKSVARIAHKQIPGSPKANLQTIHPPNTKAMINSFNEQFPFFILAAGDLKQENNPAGQVFYDDLMRLKKIFEKSVVKKDFGVFLKRLNDSCLIKEMNKNNVPKYLLEEYMLWVHKLNSSIPISLADASQNIFSLIQSSGIHDQLRSEKENFKAISDQLKRMWIEPSIGALHSNFETLKNLVADKDMPVHLRDRLNDLIRALSHEFDRLPKTLSSRIQQIKIPANSKLGLLAEGFKNIFVGLGEKLLSKFRKSMSGHNPQKTDAKLEHVHIGFDGKRIGKERAIRYDSIPQLIKSKENELAYLLGQKKYDKNHAKALKEELSRFKQYHADRNWVTSNSLREDLQKYKKYENEKAYQQSLRFKITNAILKKFGKMFGESNYVPPPDQLYIPAIVNSRMHDIEAGNNTVSIHRSGAFAYHPDGSKSFNTVKEEFIKKWDPDNRFKERREEFLKDPFAVLQTSNQEIKKDFEVLKRHERALIDQMVQYVSNQVGAHIGNIADPAGNKVPFLTGTLQLTQVSMLNPVNKDSKGLKKNEGNQMRDMAEAFRMFNGKKVVFVEGITAPFYSQDEGIIKLPKDKADGIPNAQIDQPITLSCTFFNINVHGKDDAELKKINLEALQKLNDYLEKIKNLAFSGLKFSQMQSKIKKIEERINKGETTFDLAKEIALLSIDMQGAVGINCMSGKDRTGYLIARIVNERLSKEIDQREDLSDEEKEAMKKQLRRELMSVNGMAADVVWQNTSFRFLKLKRFRVMGHNIGEGFPGHIMRLGYLIKSWGAVN